MAFFWMDVRSMFANSMVAGRVTYLDKKVVTKVQFTLQVENEIRSSIINRESHHRDAYRIMNIQVACRCQNRYEAPPARLDIGLDEASVCMYDLW